MFSAEDFEMPLEKQLKMRVVLDEIDKCTDVKALQENLKECAKSLQTYQHLLGQVLKQQLLSELESFDTEASKIIKEALEKENQNGRGTNN